MINRAPFDYFYSVFRARPVFQQGYYLDYFFLFIRNEQETIDDTLELGSLPNFKSGIDVKLPQRLLFDARAIYFFFLFSFLRQFSTPKFLIFFPFSFPPVHRPWKITTTRVFIPPLFSSFAVTSFVDRPVRFLFLFFIFLFFFKFTGAKMLSFSQHENWLLKIVTYIYFFFNRAVNQIVKRCYV